MGRSALTSWAMQVAVGTGSIWRAPFLPSLYFLSFFPSLIKQLLNIHDISGAMLDPARVNTLGLSAFLQIIVKSVPTKESNY